jgi:hypothetical protein
MKIFMYPSDILKQVCTPVDLATGLMDAPVKALWQALKQDHYGRQALGVHGVRFPNA